MIVDVPRAATNLAPRAAAAVAGNVTLDAERAAKIEALREVDAGDFASDAEVEAVFDRWGAHRPMTEVFTRAEFSDSKARHGYMVRKAK